LSEIELKFVDETLTHSNSPATCCGLANSLISASADEKCRRQCQFDEKTAVIENVRCCYWKCHNREDKIVVENNFNRTAFLQSFDIKSGDEITQKIVNDSIAICDSVGK
jgi:hypothetical protein